MVSSNRTLQNLPGGVVIPIVLISLPNGCYELLTLRELTSIISNWCIDGIQYR